MGVMDLAGKLIRKFSDRYLDHRYVFVGDCISSMVASAIVFLIAVVFSNNPDHYLGKVFIGSWFIGGLLASVAMFWITGTHRIIIRHFSTIDSGRFFVVALIKEITVLIALKALHDYTWTCSLFALIDFLLTLLFLLGTRAVMIAFYDFYKDKVHKIQNCPIVLIYGTSDKSLSAVERFKNSKHYEVAGILVYSEQTGTPSRIKDMPLYGFCDEASFVKLAHSLSLSSVIFPHTDFVKDEKERLISYCTRNKIKVMVLPPIEEYSSKTVLPMRSLKIEDLLSRDEIKIETETIADSVKDKVVMVTGAAGSIGSELCRQLANFGVSKLVLFDNAETPMHNLRLELEEKYKTLNFSPVIGDVRHTARLDFAFKKYKPQIVFHAAAYKHVPLMEENPCEAVLVNVAGSRNVADKCVEYGIEKMVMVSTDKAVNPTNVMGCTKRLAEIYVQSLGLAIENGSVKGTTKFVTTRFGNVLGSNGSVIPRFSDQISKGGPVTVTHPDITRYFMTIPEACRLVLQAAIMPVTNRICVFDMGQPVKIDTLARRMIELSGYVPDKDIMVTYSGLRPGEKLYEEVLSQVETTDPTSHDRIRIARVRSYEYASAKDSVDKLEVLSRDVQIDEMVKYMKEVVPEYISKNSRFEAFDKKDK